MKTTGIAALGLCVVLAALSSSGKGPFGTAQAADQPANAKPANPPHTMTENITHPTVKAAMDAWQGKDLAKWLSFFTTDAKLLDDGSPRDFHAFSKEIGKERFTSIDKVENSGLDIFGHFHSDQWGDFKTYFKFHLNADGKFDRLDIGQASY